MKPSLGELLEPIQKRMRAAHHEINALAQGKKRWTMSIPARETDSDLTLQAPLDDVDRLGAVVLAIEELFGCSSSHSFYCSDKKTLDECDACLCRDEIEKILGIDSHVSSQAKRSE